MFASTLDTLTYETSIKTSSKNKNHENCQYHRPHQIQIPYQRHLLILLEYQAKLINMFDSTYIQVPVNIINMYIFRIINIVFLWKKIIVILFNIYNFLYLIHEIYYLNTLLNFNISCRIKKIFLIYILKICICSYLIYYILFFFHNQIKVANKI